MGVSLAPFKGAAPNASVLFTAELRGQGLDLIPNNTIEFSYVVVDVKGKIRGGSSDAIKLTLKDETRRRIEQSGFTVFNRLDLAPGRYQVRAAAHDESGGALGSVTYDLEVPDFYKLPFSISGIVLTSPSTGAGVVAKADDQMKSVLPAPPVVARSFPQTDELAAFVEVYDNGASTAHKVDIETRLTSEEGKVVFKTDEERASSEIGAAHGGYGYFARIPLTGIAPGTYVLAIEARSRLGRDVGASREVQITVVPPPR